MDFDEYEYLEKTVENPEPPKENERENGVDKSAERDKKSSRHRGDDNGDDAHHHQAERVRPRDVVDRDRDDVRDKDRDKDHRRERESSRQRSSSRHRSRDVEPTEKDRHRSSRDRDRDRDRDREERSERHRDRDRDVREKEREKERERRRKEREREHEIELEQERELERSRRSRSRSERRHSEHDRDLDRDRERSRDREIRERELRDREREARRHKEKKEEVEPEADPERDQRTVFAYQICLKADERDVYEFFSKAGKVRDVRLIMDRNSRRSKGVGYIEFFDAMSVPMAIALSGQPLLGQPVMVKPSEAEKNLVQSTTTIVGPGGSIGPYSGGVRRLYVGNLHFNITEEQLRQVFEPFGLVELVQLPLDDTGHCKGFGFVQFARLEDARAAQSLNGQLDIAGRTIKVSAVSDQVGMQEIGVNAGDFDDDDGGGLSLNARSRAILMQKLDRSGATSSIPGSIANPVLNGPGLSLAATPVLGVTPPVTSLVSPLGQPTISPLAGLPVPGLAVPSIAASGISTIGVPSECVLLKNMFDPNAETEPDFDLDIKEDVQDECSKFGAVKHIYVDKNSAGFVYLRFDNAQSASSAQRALHGRWFAGKMIEASYMVPQNYEAKFPDSRII